MATESEVSRMYRKIETMPRTHLVDLLKEFLAEHGNDEDFADMMLKNDLLLPDSVYYDNR